MRALLLVMMAACADKPMAEDPGSVRVFRNEVPHSERVSRHWRLHHAVVTESYYRSPIRSGADQVSDRDAGAAGYVEYVLALKAGSYDMSAWLCADEGERHVTIETVTDAPRTCHFLVGRCGDGGWRRGSCALVMLRDGWAKIRAYATGSYEPEAVGRAGVWGVQVSEVPQPVATVEAR